MTICCNLGPIPLVGNLKSGGVIGLTEEGSSLCARLMKEDLAESEVPDGCRELVEHLKLGGFLAEEPPSCDMHPTSKSHLMSVYLHVTQRCDLTCRGCYSLDRERNRLPDPSAKDLCHAIDELASLQPGRLVISGGEPFLREDLPAIAGHAKAAGIPDVTILSNGLHIDQTSLVPLTGLVDRISVSFDGCSAASPSPVRGTQESFDELVSAVHTISAAGIEAHVLPTIHAENVDDVGAYDRLAKGLGATISFSVLSGSSEYLGKLVPTEEQLRSLGKEAIRRGISDELGRLRLTARQSCGAGTKTLSVAADGSVYPCHMLCRRSLTMGNLFVGSIETVMTSDVGRRMATLDVDQFDSCSECGKRYLCGGGCRARALYSSNSLTGRDPYCTFADSYLEGLGEELGRTYAGKSKGGQGRCCSTLRQRS